MHFRLTVSSDGKEKIETWKQEPEVTVQQPIGKHW